MKTISMFVIALALGTGAGVTLGKGPHWSGRLRWRYYEDHSRWRQQCRISRWTSIRQSLLCSGAASLMSRSVAGDPTKNRASFAAAYQQGFAQASGSGSKHPARRQALPV